MQKATYIKRGSESGQFKAVNTPHVDTRRGQSEALVDAVKKDRAQRVAKALRAANAKTGLFRG